MRRAVLMLWLLTAPAWAKGPRSGDAVVTRAAIAVDNARYDDAIKRISGLMGDLGRGDVTLEPERHGKALLLLATAHRARAQERDNHNPSGDLVEAMDAVVACKSVSEAPRARESCIEVGDDVGLRIYVAITRIAGRGVDAPLSTDDLAEAGALRQALQRGEEGRIRPHLAEARYRADTGSPEDADAAALAGLETARAADAIDPSHAVELASLQATVRAFQLGDVPGALKILDEWRKVVPDTTDLDHLASTLATNSEQLGAARAAAEAAPDDAKVQIAYADMLDKMGQHRAAAVWWDHATEAAPDVVELWYRRGVFHTNRSAAMQKAGAAHAALRVPLTHASESFAHCLALDAGHAACAAHKAQVDGYLAQFPK